MADLQSPAGQPTADQRLADLQQAFLRFEENSSKLEQAYLRMQEDFRKLNLELDRKNEELQKNLEETQEIRNRLNSILESLASGVVVVDVENRIIHFNRAAEMAGYKSEEVLGKTYKSVLLHGKDPKNLLHTLKTGQEIRNEERDIRTRNGYYLPVSYSTSLVKDRSGNTIGAVEAFQDISGIKQMEREIQHARTLAALGEMSATVAHEIRNPLGGIGTYAALLERDLEKGDPRRDLVRNIMQGIASLNKIVTNLLVYTRPMKGNFQILALNTLVQEISDFARLEIREQNPAVEIGCRFPKRLQYARIDPEKIQQLFLNLFFNAAQAMPKGGTITVTLKHTAKAPAACRKVNTPAWNVVGVEDTGMGISEKDLDKIFNPFFTTKENGTGLGLAIVRRIGEFHDGYLQVKSKVGKGTCMEVYLPAVEP